MTNEERAAAIQRRIREAAAQICDLWWTNGQENYQAKVDTVTAIIGKHVLGDPFLLADEG